MKVSAKLRYARISPQKLRLIADQVRGKQVAVADQTLAFMPKKGAKILRKVLTSAIANAEHNNGADIDELKISKVMIDEAPRFRRWEARAKGSGNRIIKRNSHITLQVADE